MAGSNGVTLVWRCAKSGCRVPLWGNDISAKERDEGARGPVMRLIEPLHGGWPDNASNRNDPAMPPDKMGANLV
jgi:hypothetical protein